MIDEAHHAPAKSYRDAIHLLEKARSHRLLGLTATPTRTAEDERPQLAKLFGGRVLHQVSMKELIAKELLARPIPSTVRTDVDAETGMTDEDLEHLVTFQEPSAEMLARLGRNERRNRTIVAHYRSHAARFGKTLVFTTDVAAAALLTDAFRAAGVNAQYLASYRPDQDESKPSVDRRQVLADYLDPRSGLDVLINVEMLTEGVDLPATRTVFLARPTSSEILFRQMVGRALRGPKAGGNREAYIVSFEDHWSTYNGYLDPLDWLAEEQGEKGDNAGEPAETTVAQQGEPAEPSQPVAWDQVLAVAHAIRATFTDVDADVFEAVPHGMYVLEYDADGEAIRHVIHVSDHQRPSWEALFAHLRSLDAPGRTAIDAAKLADLFFHDCDPPKVSSLEVATVVERFRAGDPLPTYIPLAGRAECDPAELAKLATERDLKPSEVKTLLADRHTPLARIIYPTAVDFRRAFDDAMREIEHPEAARPPKGVPMFEAPPSNPLRPGPHHDLQALMRETLEQGAKLLAKPLSHQGTIEWSRRPIKGWYGMAWFSRQPGAGPIKINCILNSPDFSATTLRFLLWHEYLHLFLMERHTPEFRRLERMWPGYVECDREMDALNEKFGVQYW